MAERRNTLDVDSRIVIEQAKGNRPLREVAKQVVDGNGGPPD